MGSVGVWCPRNQGSVSDKREDLCLTGEETGEVNGDETGVSGYLLVSLMQ